MGKQKVCVNHILKPEHDFPSLKGPNEGNCKVCVPDEVNNKNCCRYTPVLICIEEVIEE